MTGHPGASIPLGGIPAGIGGDSSNGWILEVPNYHNTAVFLEWTAAGQAVHRIASFTGSLPCLTDANVSCNPLPLDGIVWTPVGDTIYAVLKSGAPKPFAIHTGSQIWDMTSAGGAIWVISGKSIVKINPATRTSEVILGADTFPGGLQPNHLASSGSRIWISATTGRGTSGTGARLVSFDMSDPKGSLTVINYPHAGSIAGDGGRLWVETFTDHDELVALDGATGRAIGQPLRLPDDIAWIVPIPGGLLVSTFQDATGKRTIIPLAVSR